MDWKSIFRFRAKPASTAEADYHQTNLEIYDATLKEMRERRQKAVDAGFRLVFDPGSLGYAADFDRYKEYEFLHPEWGKASIFRLCETSPFFNVMGLMFRPLTKERL